MKRLKLSTPPSEAAPTGEMPIGVLVAPDGRRAFVALTAVAEGNPTAGRVVRIDLDTMETAGSVRTGHGPDGLGWAGK